MISSESNRLIGGSIQMLKTIDRRWLISGALIAGAEAWRIYNYYNVLAPGAELVTAATLAAAAFLPKRAAVVVPLAIMAVGDLILGNSPILAFTWTAFAAIGAAGLLLRHLQNRRGLMLGAGVLASVASAVFFFLYTNFGVWLLGDMYAHTWSGLMQCYTMALPFYRMNLVGNLIAVPLVFGAFLYGPVLARSWRNRMTARAEV